MPSTETVSRGRKSKVDKQVVQQLAETAAENLAEGLPAFEFQESENAQLSEGDDIFMYSAEFLLKKEGIHPKFTIKRYGQFLVVKSHPYSIEKLQKEYGEGSYTVFCKRPNGTIFKQQTFEVAAAPGAAAEAEEELEAYSRPAPAAQPSMMELLTFIKTFNGDSEAKIRAANERASETNRDQSSQLATVMTTMMTAMQTQAQSTQAMMLEMNKNTMSIFEKLNDANSRMFEKINDRITAATASKKDDGFGPKEMFMFLRDAEKMGSERTEKLYAMIDKKAEEKADSMKGEDESLTKQLVKGFIPVLSQAVAMAGKAPQLSAAPQPTPEQRAAAWNENQNRLARAEQARLNRERQILKQRQAGQTAQPAKTAQVVEPKTVVVENHGSTPVVISNIEATPVVETVKKNALGLPQAVEPEVVERTEKKVEPQATSTRSDQAREHISTLVLPILTEDIQAGAAPIETARKVLTFLAQNGVAPKTVLENFTKEDIMGIAKEYGLPETYHEWLAQFHAGLERIRLVVEQRAAEARAGSPAT